MNTPKTEAAIRDDAHTVQLSSLVPAWVVAWLDRYAAESGVPRAEIVRRALTRFVVEVASARGGVPADSAGNPRMDLLAPDPLLAEDRFPAQVESLLRGRRGLHALPDDGT